jgi:hypothetical protein
MQSRRIQETIAPFFDQSAGASALGREGRHFPAGRTSEQSVNSNTLVPRQGLPLAQEIALIDELAQYVADRVGLATLCLPELGDEESALRFEVALPGTPSAFLIRNLVARMSAKLQSWTARDFRCDQRQCVVIALHPPKNWPRLLVGLGSIYSVDKIKFRATV